VHIQRGRYVYSLVHGQCFRHLRNHLSRLRILFDQMHSLLSYYKTTNSYRFIYQFHYRNLRLLKGRGTHSQVLVWHGWFNSRLIYDQMYFQCDEFDCRVYEYMIRYLLLHFKDIDIHTRNDWFHLLLKVTHLLFCVCGD